MKLFSKNKQMGQELENTACVTPFKDKAKNALGEVKTYVTYAALTAPVMGASQVYAANDSGYKGTMKTVLGKMVSIIGTLFIGIGILLSAWAIGQLILAMKNDDPEGKSRAAMMLLCGVALLVAPKIINELGLLNYITAA